MKAILKRVIVDILQIQIFGFAGIISDYSTIAYLGDVYVLKEYRGKGLSKKRSCCTFGRFASPSNKVDGIFQNAFELFDAFQACLNITDSIWL